MTRWEYCDVTWQPEELIVMTVDRANGPTTETFPSAEWPQVLAKLGDEGWEMLSCTASPVGAHEYYFYFKRPCER